MRQHARPRSAYDTANNTKLFVSDLFSYVRDFTSSEGSQHLLNCVDVYILHFKLLLWLCVPNQNVYPKSRFTDRIFCSMHQVCMNKINSLLDKQRPNGVREQTEADSVSIYILSIHLMDYKPNAFRWENTFNQCAYSDNTQSGDNSCCVCCFQVPFDMQPAVLPRKHGHIQQVPLPSVAMLTTWKAWWVADQYKKLYCQNLRHSFWALSPY